jgi:hypothetical protein
LGIVTVCVQVQQDQRVAESPILGFLGKAFVTLFFGVGHVLEPRVALVKAIKTLPGDFEIPVGISLA